MARPSVKESRAGSASFASPVKSISISVNDDKAKRLQSKQMLQSRQLDQLRAAATPQRKRRSMGVDGSPVPLQGEDGQMLRQSTPVKRVVPILANFEEWMRMATDNKINATNSWNFALIDYFHDMSLLKEGDSVNFQKASCTLDGCVKIYTNRVDSVATETGKLLSGLSDSGNKKRAGSEGINEGEEDGDENDEGEEGAGRRKGRKKAHRSDATLVASFDQLRLKKMELEFAVDPLFKKASADFDEGGAKGLLLNHLAIDNTGRIVFDSSDDVQEEAEQDNDEEPRRDSMDPSDRLEKDGPVDVTALGMRFFPDLHVLDGQGICETMKTFEIGGADDSGDLPYLKAPDNWRDEYLEHSVTNHGQRRQSMNYNDDTALMDMNDGDDGPTNLDAAPEVGFGEGGEVWARDAALVPQMRPFDNGFAAESDDMDDVLDPDTGSYGVTLQHQPEYDQENILRYFDNALQKNWAGPEHWKITRIKEAHKPQPQRIRKEKEPFEIDFGAPMTQELANLIYTPAATNSAINMPRNQWKSKSRNLLPDDAHFNSKDLLTLFLKPKARLGGGKKHKQNRQRELGAEGAVDENYWAARGSDEQVERSYIDPNFYQDDPLPMAGADADDDDDDVDVFADAREVFSPGVEGGIPNVALDDLVPRPGTQDSAAAGEAFGANLISQARRVRTDNIPFAKKATKVDVRRLKEEMWRGIGFEQREQTPDGLAHGPIPTLAKDETNVLQFTDIMNNLQHVYPREKMQDISTSYGFICLLHLANEKGLVIENVDGLEDLIVRKDFEALDLDGSD